MDSRKPKISNSDPQMLRDTVEDAIKGNTTAQGLSGDPYQQTSKAIKALSGVQQTTEPNHENIRRNATPRTSMAESRPVHQPLGPTASESNNSSRVCHRASAPYAPNSFRELGKVQTLFQHGASSSLYGQSSSLVTDPPSNDSTTTSTSAHPRTSSPFHAKSFSEPNVPTQYRPASPKTIFDNMFAKMKDQREKEEPVNIFKASRMRLEQLGLEDDKPAVHVPGHPYRGDMSSGSFKAQIKNLPDKENCALWLLNIPEQVAATDLFALIKTGDVFCLHFNPRTKDDHLGKAAKLVFMTPEAARDFKKFAANDNLRFAGQAIEVRYNRNCYRRLEKKESRVLYIEGPKWYMTKERWLEYFKKACIYEMEHVGDIWTTDTRKKMEFRFCRIDGQALTCLQAITKDKDLPEIVKATFGYDPCNPENDQKIADEKAGKTKPKATKPKGKFNAMTADWRRRS